MSFCGYVAILGEPNSGKSTFINRCVGEKISIVSPKVQTSRFKVLGIVTKNDRQIVFVDTPGLFVPKKNLERYIVNQAWSSLHDVDTVLFMIDIRKSNKEFVIQTVEKILKQKKNLIFVLNKTDCIVKEKLLLWAQFLAQFNCPVFMISALKNDRVEDVVSYIEKGLPEGPFLFEEDDITDRSKEFITSEITREQIYFQLDQELPYCIHVETTSYEEDDKLIRIRQTIYVQKDSQKMIVIGEKGDRLGKIGKKARLSMQYFFKKRVHLDLFVKADPTWDLRL